MTTKGLVLVHSFDSGADGEPIDVPTEDWMCQVEGSSGWQTLFPEFSTNPGNFLHAWRVLDTTRTPMLEGTDGVFCVTGDPTYLSALKATATDSYTIQQIRDGVDATAVSIRDNWLDDRPGDPPTGEIAALRRTMAGFDYPSILEDTEPGDVP